MIRFSNFYCLIVYPLVVTALSANTARIAILAWEVADDFRNIGQEIELHRFGGYSENKLFAEIRRLNEKLNSSITPIAHKGYLSPPKSELEDYFANASRIDDYYQQLLQPSQVNNLANEILEDDVFMSNTNSYLVKKSISRKNLLEIYQFLEENKSFCEIYQSDQQILFNFYISAMAFEIKTHILTMFARYYKKIEGEDFEKEILSQQSKFEENINLLSSLFRKITSSASRKLHRCDPPTHKLGETFEEITKLIQGYIINERSLSPNCGGSCPDYKFVKKVKCAGHSWCNNQPRCNKALNCQTIHSRHFAVYSNPEEFDRRYEYVDLHDRHIHYGNQKPDASCERQSLEVFKEWLFWDCDYCFCLCDNLGPSSDRYISLRASHADFKFNRVVTGLRFVKHNRIIHLQVQEGKLLKFGEIDQSTIRWVPVSDFKIVDRKVFEGQDYHTLSVAEKKIDLDDLVVNPGHAVIGVRFRRSNGHLKLEITLAPFEFDTGKLLGAERLFKRNLQENRVPVALKYPDIPTKSTLPNYPSGSGRFVEFTNTDLQKDVAQTTVPFFDIQPVTSSPAVPLSGIGIFHKGRYGFGGFIALKIITYDMSHHIEEVFF